MRLYQPLRARRTIASSCHRRQAVAPHWVLNAIKNLHGMMFAIVLAACGGSATVVGSADVTVVADGQTYTVSVPGGASAQQAVEAAGIEMGELDRLTPAGF